MRDPITQSTPSTKVATADKAYERLLESVNHISPDLTEALRRRYEEDRRDFAKAAQDFTPSQEPKYWAKKSCSKCYGRGILGKRHIFMPGTSAESVSLPDGSKVLVNSIMTHDLQCKCTQKRYQKWLVEFRRFYNALKAQTLEEQGESTDGE